MRLRIILSTPLVAISAVMVVKMAASKVNQNSTKKTAKKEASEQQNYLVEGMAIGMGLGAAIVTFLSNTIWP